MQKLQQFIHHFNPLAVALRLLPGRGRLLTLASASLLTAGLMLAFKPSLQTLEERLGAQGWLLAPDQSVEERVIIVAIDEQSLAEVGAWPWPRSEMARLVSALDDYGVQLQLHDIAYPDFREGDEALISALQAARGAVIAQVPVLGSSNNIHTGQMGSALRGVTCDAVPQASDYVAPHAGFAGIAKGHITPHVDSDGAIRKVPAAVCVDGQVYPTLIISALMQAINSDNWNASLEPGRGWFAPEQVLRLEAYPGLSIPLDNEGNLRISYHELPENYQAVSAADVMAGRADASLLQNAWVLVGGTAFGMGDIVPTPYNGAAPGVELQARLLGSLLDASMPYTPRGATWLLLVIAAVYAAGLYILACAGERLAAYGLPIAGLALPVLSLGLHWQLLLSQEIWLGWLIPSIYALCAATLLLLLEQSRVRAERSRVFGNLSSYLPSDVAREIAYSLPSASINARHCNVTLLSADLRNFSAFSEARPPEESAALLHFFFVRITEIVERHGGRIQEFMGDAVLAVWDSQDRKAAHSALLAAQETLDAIQQDLPQQPPSGLEPLALGIGIEQGPVLMGSIGPAQRRTHTLLGDTLTITMRIQEMTAELAQPILLGESVARQLVDLKPESQGSYLLSGLRIPHTLFAPANDEAAQRRARQEQLNLKVVSGGRS